MEEKLKQLNYDIKNNNIWSFALNELTKKGNLIIQCDMDFAYYHVMQVTFVDVLYMTCPSFFSEIIFRLATEVEEEILGDYKREG